MDCSMSSSMLSCFKDSLDFNHLDSSHCSKIDFESSFFNGVVLSYWDNILGPRLGHLWLDEDHKCSEDMVEYVVTHNLNGELTRQAPPNSVDTKVFIIKERDLVFTSYIFTSVAQGACDTLYSLVLLLPFSALTKYLQKQDLVDLRMKLLIAKLRLFQEKDYSTSIENFSKCLYDQIKSLSLLESLPLSNTFSVWGSAFAPGNHSCFNSEFLEKCIISHLETFGSTVVVGKAIDQINLMMNTLALFLSEKELCQSRYPTSDTNIEFEPDIFLQSILMKEDGSYSLNSKNILTSRFPTTFINLEEQRVSQSNLLAEHSSTRHQFLNIHLESIWNDNEDAPLYPVIGLFYSMNHESGMIGEFLRDIQLIPAQATIRKAYIANFKRLIRRKALALIKYVEDITKFGDERMKSSFLQELREQLHLKIDGDFYIVLAAAEKLRPNIYFYTLGENATEAVYMKVLEELK
ncbi:guanine nucleotide exchange C9orf72-like isoform X2 [Xenia sp. Carnegie-2017]|uniref:guanine nucleotide exchange C9orf72-like isoform X2 n=1 Tax=Xenia sp. Carnegie-2017 TaxID=2897299 RepID=UPI001F04765F|nr:guanine nucleotide exchange C9orf72-like isoform X2 [Xenia sp. Carnegie-2017]